jgi:hypothetical protein
MEYVVQKHRSNRGGGGGKEDGFTLVLFPPFAFAYILFCSLWNLEHF